MIVESKISKEVNSIFVIGLSLCFEYHYIVEMFDDLVIVRG